MEEKEVLPFAVVKSAVLSISRAIHSACAMNGGGALLKLDGQPVDLSLAYCILEGGQFMTETEKLDFSEIVKTKKLSPNLAKTREYLHKILEKAEKESKEFANKFKAEIGFFEKKRLEMQNFVNKWKKENKVPLGGYRENDYVSPQILGHFVLCIKLFQYAYAIYWEALKVPISGKIVVEVAGDKLTGAMKVPIIIDREELTGQTLEPLTGQRKLHLAGEESKPVPIGGKIVVEAGGEELTGQKMPHLAAREEPKLIRKRKVKKLVQLNHNLTSYLSENAEKLVEMLKIAFYGMAPVQLEPKTVQDQLEALKRKEAAHFKNVRMRDYYLSEYRETNDKNEQYSLERKYYEMNRQVEKDQDESDRRKKEIIRLKKLLENYTVLEESLRKTGPFVERKERYYQGGYVNIVANLVDNSLLMPQVDWTLEENIGRLAFKEAPVIGIEDGLQLVSDLLELLAKGQIGANWNRIVSKSAIPVKGLLEQLLTAIQLDIGHAEFWSKANSSNKWMDTMAGAKVWALVAIIVENLKNLEGEKGHRVKLLMDAKDPLKSLYISILENKINAQTKSQELLVEASEITHGLLNLTVPENWRNEPFELDFQMGQMRQFGEIKANALSLKDAHNLLTFINGIGPVKLSSESQMFFGSLSKLAYKNSLKNLSNEMKIKNKYSSNALENVNHILAMAKSQIDQLGDFFDLTRKNEEFGFLKYKITKKTLLEEYTGLVHILAIGTILAGKLGQCQHMANIAGLEEQLKMARGLDKELTNLKKYFQDKFDKFDVKVPKMSESDEAEDKGKYEQGEFDQKNVKELKEELKQWLSSTTDAMGQEMAPFLHVDGGECA